MCFANDNQGDCKPVAYLYCTPSAFTCGIIFVELLAGLIGLFIDRALSITRPPCSTAYHVMSINNIVRYEYEADTINREKNHAFDIAISSFNIRARRNAVLVFDDK